MLEKHFLLTGAASYFRKREEVVKEKYSTKGAPSKRMVRMDNSICLLQRGKRSFR
jgi:hypothetical protein